MIPGRQRLVMAAGVVFSAGALYLVLSTIELSEAVDLIVAADLRPLAGVVVVIACQVALRALRWSILLPPRTGGGRVPFQRLIPPLLVGYLGNAILPARLGEPIRAVIASRRERVGAPEALGSVLLERVIDVATLAPIALLAALLVGAPAWATQALAITAAGGIAIILVFTTVGVMPLMRLADRRNLASRPGFQQLVARFAASLGGPSRRPAILGAVTISIAAWLLDAASFWLVAASLGAGLDYSATMLIAGIAVLSTAVPSAPGYVGTFELAAASAARALGVPAAPAVALALVAHAMTLVPLAIGGAVSVIAIGARPGELAGAARASAHD